MLRDCGEDLHGTDRERQIEIGEVNNLPDRKISKAFRKL